jgi:hypothetical protein
VTSPHPSPSEPSSDKAPPPVTRTCSGCSKPLEEETTRCPHCGLAFGEHQRCPHCAAIADVRPSSMGRFVCAVCGTPRIPIDDTAISRSHAEAELLRDAGSALAAISVWRTAAAVATAFGLFSLLILWLVVAVAPPGSLATVIAAGAACAPFVFALVGMRRASVNTARLDAALEGAWSKAAAEIARARGGKLDARALAQATRIDDRTADRIIGRMASPMTESSAGAKSSSR